MGIVAWAVALGACLAVEGIALARPHDAWPSFSDIVRVVTSGVWGRWTLFALWLWLGWHVFVRGWHFFLRAPVGGSPGSLGGSEKALALAPVATDRLLREDVIPLAFVYLVVLALLIYCSRRLRREGAAAGRAGAGQARRGWGPWLRHVVTTTSGGFGVFLAVVGLYYGMVAGQDRTFLRDALAGGAWLAFVVAPPVFAVLSWTLGRARKRPPGLPFQGDFPPGRGVNVAKKDRYDCSPKQSKGRWV